MKKLYPLLSILFLIYWGCEDKTDDNTPEVVFDNLTEVILWGVVYSIENTHSLDLSNNQLTGEIPQSLCNDNVNLHLRNNKLCPPYTSCIQSYSIGEQDTSDCD